MKQIIATDADKCRGCSTCVGVCPVGEANIISVVDEKLRILVDSQKCIACGACLRACPNNARYYMDDTERFFDDLKKGEPIALIVAPAFSTNFTNWKAILAWLKTQGVSAITDASLGIEICTWAHMRYIEQYKRAALITQPCPPIVSYIEKHRPALLGRLSPVFSPILCTAIYLKKVLKLPDKIAALTPCPAKADESEKSDSLSYNVTFKKLVDYLITRKVSIPKADFDFDNIAVAPSRVPSSLPDIIKRATGCINIIGAKIDIDRENNWNNVYGYLDEILRDESGDEPTLFDALNCPGGCINGVGGNADITDVDYITRLNLGDSKENDSGQASLFPAFDDMLELTDYIRLVVSACLI